MSPPDLTLAIAEYIHKTSYRDIPKQGIDNAKLAILDTIGVTLAGARHRTGAIMAEYIKANGAMGASTVIGQGIRTCPEYAALANGVSAHTLDYDDHGHASTQSLPAALALAEPRQASGQEFLEAYIIGREVCLHLSERFDHGGWEGSGPKGRGSHSVGIVGSLGATAAAARILELSPKTICLALGIAASLVGGLSANRGTMTKPLHAGNAARNGVLACTLAGLGFTADPAILTTPGGFAEAFNLSGPCDLAPGVSDLLDYFHIYRKGARIKAYPSCSPTHRYIEAMRLLKSKYQLTPDGVASLACTPSKSLRCLYPSTDMECRFSAAFSLVATLIEGEVNLHNCTDAFLSRPDVQDLLARTIYIDHHGPGGYIQVKTHQGEVYEQPLAHPRDLDTYRDVQDKFYACATPILGESRARQVENIVTDLEALPSVNVLTALLQG